MPMDRLVGISNSQLLGAMTLSIMTFSIMTFSIMTFSIMTFSLMTFSITMNKIQHSANCQDVVVLNVSWPECHN
jgi:hypothetical protein